jgi:hypothetical protein
MLGSRTIENPQLELEFLTLIADHQRHAGRGLVETNDGRGFEHRFRS